mmetsp:Transcript_117988/g.313926  ORF Transcript_117988/g.313926 Transcript_117988/m.313926 type:complete len:357 (-) Transcript_117988:604-1674(-)
MEGVPPRLAPCGALLQVPSGAPDEIAGAHEEVHHVGPPRLVQARLREPLDELLGELEARLGAEAAAQDLLQLPRAQGRVLAGADLLPLGLEQLGNDLGVVLDGPVARPAGLPGKRRGVGGRLPVAPLGPLVEEQVRRVLRELGALDRPGGHVHEPVGRVVGGRARKAEAFEVPHGVHGGPQVDGTAPLAQQQHLVEEREEGVPGLVDDHDDRHAQLRHLLERVDDHEGARCIEAGGGLIQEEEGGAGRQLQADVHALPLAAADAPHRDAAHDAVADVVDLHDVEDVLGDVLGALARDLGGPAEERGEVDLLADREVLVHDVVLRHEASDRLEVPDVLLLVVDKDLPRHGAVGGLPA